MIYLSQYNNESANNNITSKVYNSNDSNANKIKVGEINGKINYNNNIKIIIGKQELSKELNKKYRFSEIAARIIIDSREKEEDCIRQIKMNIASYMHVSEEEIQELYNYIHNFDFLNPDFSFFEKPEPIPEPKSLKIQDNLKDSEASEVVPELVKQEKTKPNDNNIKVEVSDNVTFIVKPKQNGVLIFIEFNNKLNQNSVPISDFDQIFNGKYDSKLLQLIIRVCRNSRKEALKILNDFLGIIGEFDPDVIENLKANKEFEINIDQFCDEIVTKDIINKGIELCFDGNSKEYIIDIIQDKYNLKHSEAEFVADTAFDIKNVQLNFIPTENYFLNDKCTQLNVPLVAGQIMKYHHFKTVGYDGKKDIYIYKNGYYINHGVTIIEQLTDQLLSIFIKDSHRSEVIKYIKNYTDCDRKELNPNMYLINLQNGIYNIKTGTFIDHNPNIVSIIRIPVKYDPKAECPQINKFLDDVTASKEDKITLLEYIGYCLVPDSSLQKAMMLYGSGSNGKSVFIDLVNDFFGFENISILSLQKMSINNFATARLYGKLLNTFSDLPSKKLATDSTFKTLTGDRRIHGEAKFKESFEFENTIRLLFSANVLPEPAGDIDDNYSYYRRWLLIPFLKTFEGKNVDKGLLNKLLTEKSGFLNLLITNLLNVLKNEGFTYEQTPEEVEAIYKANMLSLDTFFDEKIINKTGFKVKKEYLFKEFGIWCNKNKVPTGTYQTFCKNVLGRGVKDNREGKNTKISFFLDIAVKANSMIDDEIDNENSEQIIPEGYSKEEYNSLKNKTPMKISIPPQAEDEVGQQIDPALGLANYMSYNPD